MQLNSTISTTNLFALRCSLLLHFHFQVHKLDEPRSLSQVYKALRQSKDGGKIRDGDYLSYPLNCRLRHRENITSFWAVGRKTHPTFYGTNFLKTGHNVARGEFSVVQNKSKRLPTVLEIARTRANKRTINMVTIFWTNFDQQFIW